jgi:hypothetical protein
MQHPRCHPNVALLLRLLLVVASTTSNNGGLAYAFVAVPASRSSSSILPLRASQPPNESFGTGFSQPPQESASPNPYRAVSSASSPPAAGAAKSPSVSMTKATAPPQGDSSADEGDAVPTVWERRTPTMVQGGSLRTWSFVTHLLNTVQVHLRTDGRPMNANVDLWQGPDNNPQRMAVYVEDGSVRPFQCFMATPFGQNTVSVRNTAQLEYPLQAVLEAGPMLMASPNHERGMARLLDASSKTIQGGAVLTKPFEPSVQSVQLYLKTDGRPLNCRVELLQGPNNIKQCLEVYTEDGSIRPLYVIMETPGVGNVVRIVNTATIEFPIEAVVEPWDVIDYDELALLDSAMAAKDEIAGGTQLFQVGGQRKWDNFFFLDK